jgi:Ethylene-responsive protein kinase Le-CTR1
MIEGIVMASVLAFAATSCLTFRQHIREGFYDGGRAFIGGDDQEMVKSVHASALRWIAQNDSEKANTEKSKEQSPASQPKPPANAAARKKSPIANRRKSRPETPAKEPSLPHPVPGLAGSLPGRPAGLMLSPPREIILIDPALDQYLRCIMMIAQTQVRQHSDPRRRIMELAAAVAHAFGTTLAMTESGDADQFENDVRQRLRKLWDSLQHKVGNDGVNPRVVMLIGEAAGLGVCRHRALLFKFLADHSCRFPHLWAPTTAAATASSVAPSAPSAASSSKDARSDSSTDYGISVGLVRGLHGGSGHQWCVTQLDGAMYVVELYPPGKEACKLYQFGTADADSYDLANTSPISVRAYPTPPIAL